MVVLNAHHREWAIRVAAYNVVLEDERKAAEQARKQQGKRP